MRLDEVSVEDYGPLDEELSLGEGLEVIYGPNESGKTLLVDALLMLLTGKNHDDRVGQTPIGYVRLQEPNGSRRLDEDETVMDRFKAHHGLSIGAGGFRNTFVVRDADSELTSEDEYYDRATDVVAESIVDDIDRVRGAVRTAGRVTPSGLLIDRSTEIKTRTHYDNAEKLQEKIEEFFTDDNKDEIRDLEADYFEAERLVDEQSEEVQRLKAAQQRSEYETQSGNRDRLKEVLSNLADLPDAEELGRLDDEVDDALGSADDLDAFELRREGAQDLARRGVAATAVALVASLAVGGWGLSALGPSLVGIVLVGLGAAILTAIPAAVTWHFWRVRERAQAELSERRSARAAALQRGRELGVESDGVEELAVEIERLQKQRAILRQKASALMGELNGGLGLSGDDPSETLELATEELERREPELPDEVIGGVSQGDLEDAEDQLDQLVERKDGLETKLEDIRSDIRKLADDAGEIPFRKYGLQAPSSSVRTIDGLEGIVESLDALIQTIETDADNARAADDILEQLKEAEQSRVGELFFGAESAVSGLFSHFTDGRYERVDYDESENELRLRLANGNILEPRQLSQSTFDQLYLSVRLAFAEQLIEDEPGFFLLDDAFLAADADRFKRQLDIVDDLVGQGWQVVYFTAKDSDRDSLSARSTGSVHTLSQFD